MAVIRLLLKKIKNMSLKNNQGFAFVFVLVIIGVIISVIAELIYQTQLGVQSSVINKQGADVEVTVQTGVEFALFLIQLDDILKKQLGDKKNGNDQDAAKAKSTQNLPKNFYNLINGFPIGSNGLDDIEKLTNAQITKDLPTPLKKAFNTMPGYFILKVTSENTRLNVNLLQGALSDQTKNALLRMFSSPDSRRFLEVKGYTSQQLVDNMTSYIKSGDAANANDYAYSAIGAHYPPKHAPLESLEELRRIPGFHDDDIYNVFSPYFTVWPTKARENSLNINTAPMELLSVLLSPEGVEVADSQWDLFEQKKSKGKDFQEKKDINDWLQQNSPDTLTDDKTKNIINSILGTTDNLFRIQVTGVSHGVEKTFLLIVDRDPSQGDNAGPSSPSSGGVGGTSSESVGTGEDNAEQQQGSPQKTKSGEKNSSDGLAILYSAWI